MIVINHSIHRARTRCGRAQQVLRNAVPHAPRLILLMVLFLSLLVSGGCSSSEATPPMEKPPGESQEPVPSPTDGDAKEGETPGDAATGEAGTTDGKAGPVQGENPKMAGQAKGGQRGMVPAGKMGTDAMGQQGNEPDMLQSRAADGRIPYEEAFPEDFKTREPIRIGLLASPVRPEMGQRIATVLGKYHKNRLERSLGRRLRISFVSRSTRKHGARTIIHYRPDYLKAALRVASVMPDREVVEGMTARELERAVDVMVYLGDNLR